jgi:hypothetical protein
MSTTSGTSLKELDFELDGFGEQKYLTEAQGAAKQILMLLFLRPGDYPSLPKAGINISRDLRYKQMDLIVGGALKEKITDQVQKYCPNIELEEVKIYSTKYKQQYIVIIDFLLKAEKTISVALTQVSSSLINFKVDFN